MTNNGGTTSSSLAPVGTSVSGGPYPLDPQFLTPLYTFWTGDGSEEDEEEDLQAGATSCPTCAPRSGSSEAATPASGIGGTVLVCRECGGNDVHALRGTRAQAYLSRASRALTASGGGFGFGSRWFSGFGFGFGFGAGTSAAGSGGRASSRRNRQVSEEHKDLVRSVALGEKFVVSGSYDRTIKVCVSSPLLSLALGL